MKQLIKNLSVTLLLLISSVGIVQMQHPTPVYAADAAVCGTLARAQPGSGCNGNGDSAILRATRVGLGILTWVAGILAVVMMIISGFKFITSQGESSQVASARRSMLYAIVGIVLVVLSQVIVRIVISEADNPQAPASQSAPDCNDTNVNRC